LAEFEKREKPFPSPGGLLRKLFREMISLTKWRRRKGGIHNKAIEELNTVDLVFLCQNTCICKILIGEGEIGIAKDFYILLTGWNILEFKNYPYADHSLK